MSNKFSFEDPADTWGIDEGPDSTINVEYTNEHEFVTCEDEVLTNKYIVKLTSMFQVIP